MGDKIKIAFIDNFQVFYINLALFIEYNKRYVLSGKLLAWIKSSI